MLYEGGVRLWLLSYKIGVKKGEFLSVPVISVGNIVAGGTGKTGFVMYLVPFLEKMGKKVCVLTRGYGGKRKGAVPAFPGALDWGDEISLLRKHLPKTPIITGKDRIRTGRFAMEKFDADLFLLDDGFQYLKLNRDLDILLIDATNPFGDRRFLPCGFLREPVASVSRADIIVITRVNQTDKLASLRAELSSLNPIAPILTSKYELLGLENHATKERMDLELLEGKEVVAFSSIGNPVSFERELEALGAVVVKSFRFPDHYVCSEKELEGLLDECGSRLPVTTEKDGVKLPGDFPCLILKVEMVITEGREIMEQSLKSVLDRECVS